MAFIWLSHIVAFLLQIQQLAHESALTLYQPILNGHLNVPVIYMTNTSPEITSTSTYDPLHPSPGAHPRNAFDNGSGNDFSRSSETVDSSVVTGFLTQLFNETVYVDWRQAAPSSTMIITSADDSSITPPPYTTEELSTFESPAADDQQDYELDSVDDDDDDAEEDFSYAGGASGGNLPGSLWRSLLTNFTNCLQSFSWLLLGHCSLVFVTALTYRIFFALYNLVAHLRRICQYNPPVSKAESRSNEHIRLQNEYHLLKRINEGFKVQLVTLKDEMSGTIANMPHERDQFKDQVAVLKLSNAGTSSAISTAEQQIIALTKERDSLQDIKETGDGTIASLQKGLKLRIEELEIKCIESQTEKKQLSLDLSNANKEINALKDGASRLNKEKSKLKADFSTVQRSVDNAVKSRSELESQLVETRQREVNDQQEMFSLRSSLDNALSATTAAQSKYNTILVELETSKASQTKLNQGLQQTRASLKKATSEVDQSRDNVQQLRQELATVQKDSEELSSAHLKLKEEYLQIQLHNEGLRLRNEQLTSNAHDLKKANKKIAALGTNVNQLEVRLASSEGKVEELSLTEAQLKDECIQLESSYNVLQSEHEGLIRQAQAEQHALSGANANLQHLEVKISAMETSDLLRSEQIAMLQDDLDQERTFKQVAKGVHASTTDRGTSTTDPSLAAHAAVITPASIIGPFPSVGDASATTGSPHDSSLFDDDLSVRICFPKHNLPPRNYTHAPGINFLIVDKPETQQASDHICATALQLSHLTDSPTILPEGKYVMELTDTEYVGKTQSSFVVVQDPRRTEKRFVKPRTGHEVAQDRRTLDRRMLESSLETMGLAKKPDYKNFLPGVPSLVRIPDHTLARRRKSIAYGTRDFDMVKGISIRHPMRFQFGFQPYDCEWSATSIIREIQQGPLKSPPGRMRSHESQIPADEYAIIPELQGHQLTEAFFGVKSVSTACSSSLTPAWSRQKLTDVLAIDDRRKALKQSALQEVISIKWGDFPDAFPDKTRSVWSGEVRIKATPPMKALNGNPPPRPIHAPKAGYTEYHPAALDLSLTAEDITLLESTADPNFRTHEILDEDPKPFTFPANMGHSTCKLLVPIVVNANANTTVDTREATKTANRPNAAVSSGSLAQQDASASISSTIARSQVRLPSTVAPSQARLAPTATRVQAPARRSNGHRSSTPATAIIPALSGSRWALPLRPSLKRPLLAYEQLLGTPTPQGNTLGGNSCVDLTNLHAAIGSVSRIHNDLKDINIPGGTNVET